LPRDLIICPLNVSKTDFIELDEAIFQSFERPCELILCMLGTEKTTLTKLLSVMFYVGEWIAALIICSLEVLKTTLVVHEVMFQGVERPYELIFCILGFEKNELDEVA
jgi:hypothetical protein